MRWFIEVPGQISGGPHTEEEILGAIRDGLTDAWIRPVSEDGWASLSSHPPFAEALARFASTEERRSEIRTLGLPERVAVGR